MATKGNERDGGPHAKTAICVQITFLRNASPAL